MGEERWSEGGTRWREGKSEGGVRDRLETEIVGGGEGGRVSELEMTCTSLQVCTLRVYTGRVQAAAAKQLSGQLWRKVCLTRAISREGNYLLLE